MSSLRYKYTDKHRPYSGLGVRFRPDAGQDKCLEVQCFWEQFPDMFLGLRSMQALMWQDDMIDVAKHIIMPLLAGPPRHSEHTHTSPYSLVQAGISCNCGCYHAKNFKLEPLSAS